MTARKSILAKHNRKYVIGGGVIVVLVLIVLSLRGLSFAGFLDGETEKISRGDLVTPITATATIDANELKEIKAKASGRIQKLAVVEGQMVDEGQLLLELDPIDEQRNTDRMQAQLTRAEAAFEQAKIQFSEYEKTLPLNTKRAEAAVKDAGAQLMTAEVDWKKTDKLFHQTPPVASLQEWTLRKAAFERSEAALDTAQAELDRSKVLETTTLATAKENLRLAEASAIAARQEFLDAQTKLKETKVYAPKRAMVYAIRVKDGEIVQSGTTGFTGGTVLLYLADVSRLVVVAQVDEADIGAVRRLALKEIQPGQNKMMSPEELMALYGIKGEKDPTTSGPADNPVDAMLGHPVKVTVEAYRGEAYQGVIERILPQPEKINNVLTFNVRIVLLGHSLEKLLGLQADVEFTSDKVTNALRVKNEAIFSEGRESFVYIPKKMRGSNRMDEEKVPVKIGVTDGIFTEIRSGWPEGVTEYFIKRPQKTMREKEESDKKS